MAGRPQEVKVTTSLLDNWVNRTQEIVIDCCLTGHSLVVSSVQTVVRPITERELGGSPRASDRHQLASWFVCAQDWDKVCSGLC